MAGKSCMSIIPTVSFERYKDTLTGQSGIRTYVVVRVNQFQISFGSVVIRA